MKLRIIIIALTVFFFFSGPVLSQQGMQFAELAKRLDPYFAKELIMDIKKQLPQGSDYAIWGWDVGDFSGDGYFDLAFSVKLAGEKRRIMQVYMFVDIEGYLTKVGQFPYEYLTLPLEIGVVIRHRTCFITRKNKQYNWLIRGYRFDNGALVKYDEYTTKRKGTLTHETYKNYQSLINTEKYLRTINGKEVFYAKFLTIPSYHRGRQVFKGYSPGVESDDVDYVYKGAYHWKGEHDASFYVRSAHDQNYLFLTVEIRDENVVIPACDTCPADFLEVWLDVIPAYIEKGTRFTKEKKNKVNFRTSTEYGIYCFTLYPGNFREKKAWGEISTTDDLESFQKVGARNFKLVSSLTDSGFVLKCKIPFTVLGFEENPVEESAITELGCSIIYHDIDNEFRPEEETCIATSSFSPLNPSSYGSLLLIPKDYWYGETINIYKDDILKYLMENGY